MANDNKTNEPDMDEILTSIRRIISDGDAPQSGSGNDEPRSDVTVPAGHKEDDILHLTDKIEEEAAFGAQWPVSHPQADSEESFVSELPPSVPGEGRIPGAFGASGGTSEEGGPSIAESLEAIAGLIGAKDPAGAEASQPARSRETQFLEDLAAETLRREIRAWLDENLPGLAERLVREEIENLLRLARDRR